MPEIELTGYVVPKPRPRVVSQGGRTRSYTPRMAAEAEHRIRETWLAAGWGTQDGPLYVEVRVLVGRPIGHYRTSRGERLAELLPSAPRWPAVRPDLDNYAKTALDALRGVAYQDDGQIVRAYLAKMYARGEQAPGWRIGVFPLEEDDGDDTRDEASAAGRGRAAPVPG